MNSTPYGFRIVGDCTGDRRLIDWRQAFSAYCAADARAGVEREAYLSAFAFGEDFRAHLASTSSTKGYAGPCGAAWLWFDIDRDEAAGGIEAARRDTAALVLAIESRYSLDPGALLIFYSGSKGFHIGLPTAGWNPAPSPEFHAVARRFAENVAAAAGVVIDTAVYDRVRAFRAPNSRHPKTGRHKRRFSADELMHLSAARIIEVAADPAPFDLSDLETPACSFELPAAWNEAAAQVRQQTEAQATRRAAVVAGTIAPTLNRLTLEFIREGAANGERQTRLYSAAANLHEYGAPLALAEALLSESALDSGLAPSEVARTIRCAFDSGKVGAA